MRDGWETTWGLASLALVALIAVAGCVGSDGEPTAGPTTGEEQPPAEPPDPVTILTDPEGDATRQNSDWAQTMTPCAEADDAPEEAPDACQMTHGALSQQEPAGAVPAHPARDVLEIRFQETATTLEVFMDVAELDESLDDAIQETEDGEGYDGTTYYITWQDPTSGCTNELWFFVGPGLDFMIIEPVLWVHCEQAHQAEGELPRPCTAPFCNWEVPFEIEHGSPATLHWSVPRAMLASSQLGEEIPRAVGGTVHISSGEGPEGSQVKADGPVDTDWIGSSGSWYALDRTEPGTNFTFAVSQREELFPTGTIEASDQDVRVEEPLDRPDLSFTNLTLEPTPDRFRIEIVLEEVAEEPRNHTLPVTFGIPGHTITVGYVARDGQREPFAERIGAEGNPVSIPVSMSVAPAEPGSVTFELLRSDLPEIPDGALLQTFHATIGTWESEQHGVAGAGISRGQGWLADVIATQGLHRIPADPSARSQDPSTRIGDTPGDVDPPPEFTGTSARYDLLGAEIVSPAPDEMRFGISIEDLSDLSPPMGYDAVFYAIGIEHPNGETMVGHYRSDDRPGGEFLCAPDTTVLTDQPGDPTQTAWTTVEGTVLTSSSSQGLQGTNSGSSGAIVVTAPASCFGLEEGADGLNVTGLEAGSYLIRRSEIGDPSGEGRSPVQELDTLAAEEGFQAAFAEPVQPAPPSFWAQPFGVENFWDVFGAFVAVVTVLVTFGLWLRRRWTFKRYLAEINRIQEAYRHDARARATALVELRRDLYEDLERHRISDSHYPIVLDRLRSRLTSARLTSIGQAFYDLPPHLALRIERMLDDGHLAEEECEVLEPVIEGSAMQDDARELLRDRLERWVREDREHLDTDVPSAA